MVFSFKCYKLPFFGWWDGNVDKYSVLIFFSCNLIYILVSICVQKQVSMNINNQDTFLQLYYASNVILGKYFQ